MVTIRGKSFGLVTPPAGCEVDRAAVCLQAAVVGQNTDCCNPKWQVNGLSDQHSISRPPQTFDGVVTAPGLSEKIVLTRGLGGLGSASAWGNSGVAGGAFVFSSDIFNDGDPWEIIVSGLSCNVGFGVNVGNWNLPAVRVNYPALNITLTPTVGGVVGGGVQTGTATGDTFFLCETCTFRSWASFVGRQYSVLDISQPEQFPKPAWPATASFNTAVFGQAQNCPQ